MSLPDTAEYWQDVKRPRMPYIGPDYYHVPGAECGRKHWYEAKAIGDVNCKDCLKLIEAGYDHGLPEGKTDFRSNSQKKRDAQIEKQRLENEKLPKCTCGHRMMKRTNRATKEEFYGCTNYPKCKNTSKIGK